MVKKLAINSFVVLVALIAGLYVSRRPWEVWVEQRQKTTEQKESMHRSESKREELLRREARAKTSIGHEEMARAQGWLKPGEKALGDR